MQFLIKNILFIVLGLVIGVSLYSLYVWHDHRKSNTDERSVHLENYKDYSVATFAGGCFWCSESDFEKTDGVVEAISGYTGGQTENPTYKETSSGVTGHREAVQVYYDESIVSYEQLLDVFWRHHDPTDAGGSFGDRGTQYGSAIFYHNTAQEESAKESKKNLDASDVFEKPVMTPIIAVSTFYPAEDYHQNYAENNPKRYGFYRGASGRDDYVQKVWGNRLKEAQNHASGGQEQVRNQEYSEERNMKKFTTDYNNYVAPSEEDLRENLTKMQYKVTQKSGTEQPFKNEYWDNHEDGIYVDIISGEPLYSSTDKYDSGTGWPSFLKPIEVNAVTEHDDYKLIIKRTEVRSETADSHLGHILLDGPESNNNVRHCINSASLRFVHKDKLEEEGYGEYRTLFEN